MTDTTTYAEEDYPLTEEECLKIGGHCYEVSNSVFTTNPLIYTRTCKHCGHKQEGQRQDDYDWHDIK